MVQLFYSSIHSIFIEYQLYARHSFRFPGYSSKQKEQNSSPPGKHTLMEETIKNYICQAIVSARKKNKIPPPLFSILINGTTIHPFTQAKSLGIMLASSLFLTPITNSTFLALLSKYILNPTTSHHLLPNILLHATTISQFLLLQISLDWFSCFFSYSNLHTAARMFFV